MIINSIDNIDIHIDVNNNIYYNNNIDNYNMHNYIDNNIGNE